MSKGKFRQTMLARRRSLSSTQVEAMGSAVQRTFMASNEFAGANTIALYAAIQNEVATADVLKRALALGKAVLYPSVSDELLHFRQVTGPGSFKEGAFGIPEPDGNCTIRSPLDADVIVVPGIVFDLAGRRIGYGKGYYDRTLHHLEGKGKLVAFCYDFQLITEIVGEPHDVVMDMIITERRVVRPQMQRD